MGCAPPRIALVGSQLTSESNLTACSSTVLADIPVMTVHQAIEGILINHVHEHLGSIRATTGAK